jgi:DNA-binding NtrC family response regulator
METDRTVTTLGETRKAGEKLWISPPLADAMRPMLGGLAPQLLETDDRDLATLRVKPAGTHPRQAGDVGAIRIELADAERPNPTDFVEFELPGLLPAASYIVSRAFGINPLLLTADPAMFSVMRAAARAGQVDSPVLVSGETGTGKELIVRLIHAASHRAGRINCMNCAALNESALPSRGPFGSSGSERAQRKPGDEARLRELCMAPDTTFFLDQVSELSSAAQACVLHVLVQVAEQQEQEHRPGARLICATNRPLAPMVIKGEFKRELCDRIAVLTLSVPPLRQRRADIALLATDFLSAEAPQLRFTPGALKLLNSYPFPGNVRELHNLVTRLAIMRREGAGHSIHTSDIRPELVGTSIAPFIWNSSSRRLPRDVVVQALVACGGDRAAAARTLGISMRALEKHVGIEPPPLSPRSR